MYTDSIISHYHRRRYLPSWVKRFFSLIGVIVPCNSIMPFYDDSCGHPVVDIQSWTSISGHPVVARLVPQLVRCLSTLSSLAWWRSWENNCPPVISRADDTRHYLHSYLLIPGNGIKPRYPQLPTYQISLISWQLSLMSRYLLAAAELSPSIPSFTTALSLDAGRGLPVQSQWLLKQSPSSCGALALE